MRSLLLLAVVSFAAVAADPPAAKPDKDYDFGDKVLYVVSKATEEKKEFNYGLVEKVKIVRLADRPFLLGQVPDYGDDDEVSKAAAGKKVWTPVSDIVQMTEFATMEEAKKYFKAAGRDGGNPARR